MGQSVAGQQQRVAALLQNLGALALLAIAFPVTLAVTLAALLVGRSKRRVAKAAVSKRVLITGGKMTKALQLARSLHAAGHEVILVETRKYWLTGHRFSRAVRRFYTIPELQEGTEVYRDALVDLARRERIDLFVPVSSPASSIPDAIAGGALSEFCEVLHGDPETIAKLDDKYQFAQVARSLGLPVPKTFSITRHEQVLDFNFDADDKKYLLKSVAYDSCRRLDRVLLPLSDREEMARLIREKPVSPERPWIMQEYVPGQEYCAHGTVRDGVVQVYCCSRSSAFQVNYEQVHHPKIEAWVRQFAGQLGLSGQYSFDFLERGDGDIVAIECNPRVHSAISMFHDHPQLAAAYTSAPTPDTEPLRPLPNSKPTYWLYHELWRANEVRSLAEVRAWFDRLRRGTDAIFRLDDPLPFLMVHHWQIPLLLLGNLRRLQGWVRIDFNIGKLVELGGD